VCYSVLQFAAVCCSCCRVLQCVAVCCSVCMAVTMMWSIQISLYHTHTGGWGRVGEGGPAAIYDVAEEMVKAVGASVPV